MFQESIQQTYAPLINMKIFFLHATIERRIYKKNRGNKKADDSVCSSLTSKNNDFACVFNCIH